MIEEIDEPPELEPSESEGEDSGEVKVKSRNRWRKSKKCETGSEEFSDSGILILGFYSRHLKYAHPGIHVLARPELKSCMLHLSDPELIADSLKYKRIFGIQGFTIFLHNVDPR